MVEKDTKAKPTLTDTLKTSIMVMVVVLVGLVLNTSSFR